MRFLAIMAMAAGPVMAQELPSDPAQSVIQQQLNAFQADDFATAFTYASPMIKRLFGAPERFEAMVKSGFPMVWRPGEVTFLGQEPFGGGLRQLVMIKDSNARLHFLRYEMLQSSEGWQINGVEFVGTQSGA